MIISFIRNVYNYIQQQRDPTKVIIKDIHNYEQQLDPINQVLITKSIESKLDSYIRQRKNFDNLFSGNKKLDDAQLRAFLNSIAKKKLIALKNKEGEDDILRLVSNLLNFVNAYRGDNKGLLSNIKEATLDSIKKADKPFDKLELFNNLRKFVDQKGLDADIVSIILQIKKQIQEVKTDKMHIEVQREQVKNELKQILNELTPISFLKPEGPSGGAEVRIPEGPSEDPAPRGNRFK